MKEYNKYVRKWQEVSIKLNEAMQKDDFELADKLMSESVDTYKNTDRWKDYIIYSK